MLRMFGDRPKSHQGVKATSIDLSHLDCAGEQLSEQQQVSLTEGDLSMQKLELFKNGNQVHVLLRIVRFHCKGRNFSDDTATEESIV